MTDDTRRYYRGNANCRKEDRLGLLLFFSFLSNHPTPSPSHSGKAGNSCERRLLLANVRPHAASLFRYRKIRATRSIPALDTLNKTWVGSLDRVSPRLPLRVS